MSKIKHSFKYLKAGRIKHPLIPIVLKHNKQDVSNLALIDSWADFNVFHTDIATILRIDLSKLQKIEFGGIKADNKPCVGYLATVRLGVNNEYFDSAVLFSSDISPNGYPVLGQMGFFDHFKVTLDYTTDNIYLKSS